MTITPRAQALRDLTPVDAAHFTGKAGLRTLLPASGPLPPTSVAVVRFETGVRNHWHGAGRSGPFAHLVVNVGETRWLEASPPPPD